VAFLQRGGVGGVGDGRDAVHHGGGKTRLRFDPPGQGGVAQRGQRQHRRLQHLAVVLDVVAAQRGEGGPPARSAAPVRLYQHADRAARPLRFGEVSAHQRIAQGPGVWWSD
jgi:hypothetical protein